MAEEKTLEQAFHELDTLISRMGNKDLPLEDAFKMYQEGVSLLKFCNQTIDRVEKNVIEIHGVDEDDE